MHKSLRQWLSEIEDETEVVTSSKVIDETRGNQVKIGFNEDLLSEWGKQSVKEFLIGCCAIYESRKPEDPMWFYSWYDQESGHFCICTVRQAHGRLPFKCELNLSSLDDVVDSIFALDSGLFTQGKLIVWQKSI